MADAPATSMYVGIVRSRNKATLSSFGDEDTNKYVYPGDSGAAFTLQGNNGSWVTIPADEYALDIYLGTLVQRAVNDDGDGVDWSGYSAYRATYTVYESTIETTYTNETVTFAEDETGFFPVGAEGQVHASLLSRISTLEALVWGQLRVAGDVRMTVAVTDILTLRPSYVTVSSGTLDLDNTGGTGVVDASNLIISTSSGNFTIRSIGNLVDDGQVLFLFNNTGNNMTLTHLGSVPALYAQLRSPTGADIVCTTRGSAILIYNLNDDAWLIYAYIT